MLRKEAGKKQKKGNIVTKARFEPGTSEDFVEHLVGVHDRLHKGCYPRDRRAEIQRHCCAAVYDPTESPTVLASGSGTVDILKTISD